MIDNEIYDDISDTWWEQDGFMALLRTSINPPRFRYFNNVLVNQQQRNPQDLQVLDVGCGGGLLSEEFAKIGCQVTGVDQSKQSLVAARAHAQKSGLDIEYIESTGEALPFDDAQFDIVCCCDVLEHVDDIHVIITQISRVLKPGGIFFFDTINRTLKSNIAAIKVAQDWWPTRFIPQNVHVWDKFIKPHELAACLKQYHFASYQMTGLAPAKNPICGLSAILQKKLGLIDFQTLGNTLMLEESKDMDVSYMGYAIRAE